MPSKFANKSTQKSLISSNKANYARCLIFVSLFATSYAEEPILVNLATESQLYPLHLSPIYEEQSGFASDYLKSLEKVLQFDLSHNGQTRLVESPKASSSFDNFGELANADYAVKVRVKDKKLGAKLLFVHSNRIKTVEGLALSGDLKKDRRQIHLLADQIFKAIFNREGIASTHILYTIKTDTSKKGISEVFESDYDGANVRQVTSQKALCVTPCYIPAHPGFISRSFAFVSYEIGQPKIYFGSLDEGTIQRFSTLKGNQFMPACALSRDKIAFISDVTGNPDLFMQDYDFDTGQKSKPRQIFFTPNAVQGSPTFSPDGKRIAFVSNKDGAPRIYLMNLASKRVKLKDVHVTLLTKQNRENTAPCWSSDGEKIAYSAMTNGTRQIWIYDFVKKQERQLTFGPGHKENPCFAPNSLHLIFNSNNDLFLINLNQKEPVRITSGKGEKRFPSWEPRV